MWWRPNARARVFFDNNILASKYWRDIFIEISELGMEVDFNQGLDARLLTEEAADLISKMDIPRIRLAYDEPSDRTPVKKVIKLLKQKGIPGRRLFVYTLYNYTESPDEFFNRVKDILEWGAVCYPMQFQPCETLNKNTHVSEKWTAEKLNMVASTRRVIGFGGAFPPYEALVDKFQKEKNFMEAFTLRPIQTT